jgi:hypothetical protein
MHTFTKRDDAGNLRLNAGSMMPAVFELMTYYVHIIESYSEYSDKLKCRKSRARRIHSTRITALLLILRYQVCVCNCPVEGLRNSAQAGLSHFSVRLSLA